MRQAAAGIALIILVACMAPSRQQPELRTLARVFSAEYRFEAATRRRLIVSTLEGFCDYLHVTLNRVPNPSDLSRASVQGYLRHMGVLYDLSPLSLRSRLWVIKAFAADLHERGHVNSAHRMRAPGIRPLPKESLTAAELVAVREALAQSSRWSFIAARNVAMFDVLRWTGLRAGELIVLRAGQINFRTATIQNVLGKGGRVDNIPMHPRLVQALLEYSEHWTKWLSKHDDVFRGASQNVRGRWPVIPAARRVTPGEPDSYRTTRITLYRTLKAAFKEAGCSYSGSGCHTLRRTLATQLRAAGVPLYLRARVLRHESETTTERYEQRRESDMREALLKI